MQQKLWINRWNDKRKASAVRKQEVGIGFLSNYQMTDFHKVLYNLQVGLETTKGSNTSSYVTFIPPSGNEVVKVRLSDHPSTIEEWEPNELTGLPNRRYSIVIFSNKSMPNESKQKLKELNWKCYKSQNIPVYEKTFNRYYLKETFPKLISILQTIYKGGAPEDKSLPVNITENNQQINENKTMNKKQTIRLNENQLKRIIKESVKRVLNEEDIDYDSLTPFQKSHLSMSGVDLKGSQFDNVLFDITIEVLSKLHNFDPIDKPNFADDYPNEFEAAYRAAQMGYDYAKKNKTPRGWTHILTGYPNEY